MFETRRFASLLTMRRKMWQTPGQHWDAFLRIVLQIVLAPLLQLP